VVPQYRLGTLGFMHLEVPHARVAAGGLGLYDQQLALAWVQEYIGYFGGDPKRVTVGGQSSGALATAAHLVTPSSAQLYQQAIIESSPFGAPLQTEQQATQAGGSLFLRHIGCALSNASLSLECMLAKSWQQVMAAQQQAEGDMLADLRDVARAIMPWGPTIGSSSSSFLKDQVLIQWQQQKVSSVPLMMGTVETEGVLFVEGLPTTFSKLYYPLLIKLLYGSKLGSAVLREYQVLRNDSSSLPALARVITDGFFKCALRNATRSVTNRAFIYNFKVKNAQCLNMTCHGDELFYLFSQPGQGARAPNLSPSVREEERELSAYMQERWGNFVKTGVPGPRMGDAWPQFLSAQQDVLMLDASSTIVVEDPAPFNGNCDVWDQSSYFK